MSTQGQVDRGQSATQGGTDATELRAYGGEQGADRVARRRAALIEAALELLGAEKAGGTVTVRGVCRQAGLTARYFYESFETAEQLVAETFDEVIGEISTKALEGFESGAEVDEKVAHAVGAIVGVIDEDRRKGRLLFSQSLLSPTVAAKRAESTALFAGLTLQSAAGVMNMGDGPLPVAAVHYQVGGLGRLLASWLDGEIDLDRDGIIEVSVLLLLAFASLIEDTD